MLVIANIFFILSEQPLSWLLTIPGILLFVHYIY